MTVYVLAKAYATPHEWVDIVDTQVFKTIDEARESMLEQVNEYLNDPDDVWAYDWGKEPNPVSIHLSCHNGEDEVVWAISEHEI